MPTMIRVLDPTGIPREARERVAARLDDLRGKTVGFVWNSKPNGDLLFEHLARLLRDRYEVRIAEWVRKPSASRPAQSEDLDSLSKRVHGVIIGLAD